MSISDQFKRDMQRLMELSQKTLTIYQELEELHQQGIKDDVSIAKDAMLTSEFESDLSALKDAIEQIQKVDPSVIINDL